MKFIDISAFVFDFDGVLTNNLVHLDQSGDEWVSCSRSDGLAFDALRKLNKPTYIISTEENSVVSARAKKLKVEVFQGVKNKANLLSTLAIKHEYNLKHILYVGNDLNDYHVMKSCGFSVCPSDSHPKIRSISNITLKSKGGNGIVRELLEDVFGLDLIKILY
ncbi:HAD hydrolase family protein [Methylophilaceae bacterium]|nr:HAD hydrolase family protein [Methylophilaceae bacterium]